MATYSTSAAEVDPGAISLPLTPSTRGGVIFQAVIGGISAIAILLLLGHLITVSFLPLFLSALNIRKNQETAYYSSSTGTSTSGDMVATSALPDRNSHAVTPLRGSGDGRAYGIDLEGAIVMAGRRASARARKLSRQNMKYDKERLFLRMQLDIFVVCVTVSGLIQSVGVLIQAHWAHMGAVKTSTACSVQGAMLSFGGVATAVWNSVVAIHTFSTVVLGLRMSTLGVTIVGWSIPILMNVIGAVVIVQTQPAKPYYNVTLAWCFISNDYNTLRVVLYYVPLLFAALIITTMYVLVSLTMRGNLQVTSVSRTGCLPWFSFSFRRTSVSKSTSGNTNLKQVAYLRALSLKMLWYPCVYICLILPGTVCRMVELRNAKPPSGVQFFATTLLCSVGLSNVIIYVTTRNIGVRSKRNTTAQPPRPPHFGTQVEIHIGRVTENDVGVVATGGIGLSGHDKHISFEGVATGDRKDGSVSQKNGYDVHPRNSLEQDYPYPDAKSPISVTQFVPDSPQNWALTAAYHPQYTLKSPSRTHNHRRSLGSVVVDRLGRQPPLQERRTPFDGSLHEGGETVARSQSLISPFRQFGPGTRPLSCIEPAVRNPYHTWE